MVCSQSGDQKTYSSLHMYGAATGSWGLGLGMRLHASILVKFKIAPSCISVDFFVYHALGRRIVELSLHIALTQLVRKYRVEYLEETPMDYVQKFMVQPDRKLNLVFADIS